MKQRIAEYRAIAQKEKLEELGVKSAIQSLYKGAGKAKDKVSDYKSKRKVKKDIKKDKKKDKRWGDKIKSYVTGKSKFESMSASEIAQHAIRMKDGNEPEALQYVQDQAERLSSNTKADHKVAIANLEKAAKGLEAAVELGKDESGNYVRAGSPYAYKTKVAAGKATDADHEAHKDGLKKSQKDDKKKKKDKSEEPYSKNDAEPELSDEELVSKTDKDIEAADDSMEKAKKLKKQSKDPNVKLKLEKDKETITNLLINYTTGKSLSYEDFEKLYDLNSKYEEAFDDLLKKMGVDLGEIKQKKKNQQLSSSFEKDFTGSDKKKDGENWKTKEGVFAGKYNGKVMYFAGEDAAKTFSSSGKLPAAPANKKQVKLDSLSHENLKHEQIRLLSKINSDEAISKEERASLISQAANVSMEIKKRQDKKDKENHKVEMQSNPEYKAEVERIEREEPEKSREDIAKELQKKDRQETQMIGQLKFTLKESPEVAMFRREVNKYLKIIS